jgi:lipopolysaccharide biosynthesis regulator YciM
MADDVRRWSDELARDPASLVFLPLGETLRRQGQLDLALKIAMRGLERHSHNTDAHDLLARIAVDRGELQRAFDEWDMVLRLTPGHLGALKGMAFVRFQQGNTAEAEQYLQRAAEQGGDAEVAAALANLRGTRDGGGGTRDAGRGMRNAGT